MKLKDTFILTELSGDIVAVPLKEKDSFHGIIRLNSTGATVIQGLLDNMTEEQIAEKLADKYEGVDYTHAREAVSRALNLLRENNLLETEE